METINNTSASVREAKKGKYIYLLVIQQNYGQGWEDNSEYACNSNYYPYETERIILPNDKIRFVSLFSKDLKEYRLTGYSTRSIRRRIVNKDYVK